MKGYWSVILFLFIFFLEGCASSPRTRRVEILTKLQEEVDALKQSKADTRVQIEDMKTEIQVLSGKLEETTHSLKTMEEALQKNNEKIDRWMADYDEKINSLENQINKKPTTSHSTKTQTPESAFSLAEKLFAKKDYEAAILKYEEYKEKNPKGNKIPEALFKQGLAFKELGKLSDAKSFFEGVISDFPKSPFAKKAKAELGKIK